MKQIWNDIHGEVHPHTALDFLPKEQLRALQSQRLKEITKLAYDNVELFRNRMRGACPDCEKKELCMGGCPLMPEIVFCNSKERKIIE